MHEDDHVEAAKQALLKSAGRLNVWETCFLESMLHTLWPLPKRLTYLEILVAKASMRADPRAKARRAPKYGRRARR